MPDFIRKTRNSNSVSLLKEITEFIEGIISNYDITWESNHNRDSVLEIIDEKLEDLMDDRKISQWNVICDRRNNSVSDSSNKITNLDITYQQLNCYNTTELHYIIQR